MAFAVRTGSGFLAKLTRNPLVSSHRNYSIYNSRVQKTFSTRNDSSACTNAGIIAPVASITNKFSFVNSPRCFSSDRPDDGNEGGRPWPKKRTLPTLMDFPEIVWPSVLKSIKNWILVHLIIRPYFDRDFNLPDFVAGTKHALQIVSARIAEGDFASLTDLVASDTVSELRASMSKMTMSQRSELQVIKDDVYLSFPYQIGIMFDESNEKVQKRWVEITMVFHVLRGLREMQERGQPPPLNLGMLPEYRDKVSICNYRFIKEFTQGNESDWTINIINHFKPADYIDD